MKYIMGIDLGTSSVKAVVTDLAGHTVSRGQAAYEILRPQPDWAEQSPDTWWECTKTAVREAIRQAEQVTGNLHLAKEITAVGLSGQMHGLTALDSGKAPLRNCIIWADKRSQLEIDELCRAGIGDELSRAALNGVSPGFLLSSMLWMKKWEPDLFGQIDTVLFPKDYIRFRLTGRIGTDITDASGSGIFDAVSYRWPETAEKLGIPLRIFPPIFRSHEIAGGVTESAADETGLEARTPVVFGGGDTPMHTVGNGLIRPGMLSVNIGTAAQIAGCVGRPYRDRELRCNTFCLPVPDRWLVTGAVLNGGIVMDWLKNKILQIEDYREVDELASSAPFGNGGLYFLPYLMGERTPHMNPEASGCYFGLRPDHDRGCLLRAAMEGTAFALKEALDVVEEAGDFDSAMIASGGGARSRFFLQMMADIFHKKVRRAAETEEACLGACMTAAVGVGLYPDYESACAAMTAGSVETYEPDETKYRLYQERFSLFQEIYRQNVFLFSKIELK